MNISWTCKHYSELGVGELYQIMQARLAVFVIEQQCFYQDFDGKDQDAWHCYAQNDSGALLAYCRLLKPGVSFADASIGRVLTTSAGRSLGLGRSLMQTAIEHLQQKFPGPIRIGAQQYLEGFYHSLGFVTDSAVYLEDDIPHLEMIRRP
jgi:ElaA protein